MSVDETVMIDVEVAEIEEVKKAEETGIDGADLERGHIGIEIDVVERGTKMAITGGSVVRADTAIGREIATQTGNDVVRGTKRTNPWMKNGPSA